MDYRVFWLTYLLCIGLLLAVIAGCGGGGGGSSNGGMAGPRGLSGTWFGAAEDETGQLHSVKLTMDETRVTSFAVDGADIGGSGPLSQDEPQVYSAVLTFGNGQLQVVLFSDPAAAHLVYLDNFFRFGVLQ